MSMCRLVSWVVGKGCLLWSACFLDKTLLAFALLHFELQGQTCLLFWVSLDFLLFHSNPLWWTWHLFLVFVLEGIVFLHRTSFSFFDISGWGVDLEYCGVEWLVLETNRDHSVLFEIAPRYCISDSFVDSEGYSISSKGSLTTVVDKMVIWMKSVYSHPF